jgi:SAM-dependent methyltransferase
MKFTGERFVPEVQGNIELEHLHRYLQACELVAGKVALDIASGEGYGSVILASKAKKVFGVDVSVEAVNHAQNRYKFDNLEFIAGDCSNIPLRDMSVDVVVSFETIEHHDQHEKMLQEIKRVLKPTGLLLISSPDKYYYSEEPGFVNAYHVKELYQDEFKKLINSHFSATEYYGQRVAYGSIILPESRKASAVTYAKDNGDVTIAPGLAKPTFWIALASNIPLPEFTVGLFEQPVEHSEAHQWKENELSRALDLLKLKDEHLATASELLHQRSKHLVTAAELLRQKDEHLATAAELLRQKDEHLATAAQLINERDILLARYNPWRSLFIWLRNRKWI